MIGGFTVPRYLATVSTAAGVLCGEITEDEAPILSALRLFPLVHFGGSLLRLDVALEVVDADAEEVGRALDQAAAFDLGDLSVAHGHDETALGRLVFRLEGASRTLPRSNRHRA